MPERRSRAEVGSGTRAATRRLDVILVEDDEDARVTIAESLRADGWDVRAFARGEDALLAIAARVPDLVLTDMRLGEGMGGHELAARLRLEPCTRALPIVAVTGRIAPSMPMLAPFDAYLLKPVELPALAPMLRTMVEERRAAEGG